MNLDAGELDDEDESLWCWFDWLAIACGGHTGDAASMERVVGYCVSAGKRIAAHPSYPDREGFGRRSIAAAADQLAQAIHDQCAALATIARRLGSSVAAVKPHGALYHDAAKSRPLAEAVIEGAVRNLGPVTVIGPPGGELARVAEQRGLLYLREGFADRGVRDDGSLIPRGQPGALITDPGAAAARMRLLRRSSTIDTVCVHGDTPGARAIARAVRGQLWEWLGDRAIRFARPRDVAAVDALHQVRRWPGVTDAVIAPDHIAAYFGDDIDRPALEATFDATLIPARSAPAGGPRDHRLAVIYDGEDLAAVAAACGLTRDEVCARHAAATYRVDSIGFAPGFGYLTGGDPQLAIARRATPRPRVAANSLALAAGYSAIYPFDSPAGWHVIGRYVGERPLFGPAGALLQLGDSVRFVPVDRPAIRSRGESVVADSRSPHAALDLVRVAGLVTVQDLGRRGHMHEGIAPGGALVPELLRQANLFAGNPPHAPALEILGRVTVRAASAISAATHRGPIECQPGVERVVDAAPDRAVYLAIRGGIASHRVLDGSGTQLSAGLGRALRTGDRIGVASTANELRSMPAAAPARASALADPIAIVIGPDRFSDHAIEALTTSEFTISPASDRVGTRLVGPPLATTWYVDHQRLAPRNRPHPLVRGAIEVPPDGRPIIMGPEHPTTGGYPIIAVVAADRLDALFRIPLGGKLRFRVR